MGNSHNQARKSARNRIPNEILEEIIEKKRKDMTNQRCSMDPQPIPIVEDATVLPTNPHQERQKHSLKGPSVTTSVEKRALHGTYQGVKCRCTSRAPKTFADIIESGYTSDEVRETLNAEGMLEEDNVVQTTQEYFQLPPSDRQEDTEGHEAHVQMPDRPGDMVQGAIPTSLSPLVTARRRNPKRIQIDESLIGSLEGTLSKRSIAYQAQHILVNYFDSKCDGDKCRLFILLLKSRSMNVVRKNLRIKMINRSEPSSHVVRSLVDAFSTIGNKYCSKDRN